MTTLYIDADACPVTRETLSLARSAGVRSVLVSNESQDTSRFAARTGVETIRVGTGRDAADFAIVELLEPGDVVITQDIGLAAMVLGRGGHAVSPRGRRWLPETIDMDLEVRHAEQRHRRTGGRTRGPAPFTADDRERFVLVLRRLLADLASGGTGPR